jgi:hypothetical protein
VASPAPAGSSSVQSTAGTASRTPSRITKVLTVVEENHGLQSASRAMPYLASLAADFGSTTGYRSLTHPSLPNYLALAGGSPFGVHNDAPPSSHHLRGRSVFDAALASGRTAKTYAESMSDPCQLTSSGRYAVKHNPWAYFSDAASRRGCRSRDVPAGTPSAGILRTDIARGALPQVGLLVPDLCHDAHDCSLATADTWLRRWMQVILAGPDYRAGRLAVVITFDEVEGGGGGPLLTAVVAPPLRHRVVNSSLNHLSWSRWMTDLVGAAPLRSAGTATSLGRAFGLS